MLCISVAPVQHLWTIYSLSGMCYLGKLWLLLPRRMTCLPRDISSPLRKKNVEIPIFPAILSPIFPFPPPIDIGIALGPQVLILYYFRGFLTSWLVDWCCGLGKGEEADR